MAAPRPALHRHGDRPTWLMVLPWSLGVVGGVNQVVLNLAKEITKAGKYKPLVLIPDWGATRPVIESHSSDQGDIAYLRWRVRTLGNKPSLRERLFYKAWRWKFRKTFEAFCLQHDVAVVNPHYTGAISLELQSLAAGFAKPVPVIHSFHGTDITTLQKSPFDIEQWRSALGRAGSAAVACSHALARRLAETLGAETPCAVVHNGIDMDLLIENAGAKQPRPRRVVLSVGKFELQKGQFTLLDAFAQIQVRFLDVDLVLIGGEAAELPNLRAQAQTLGIESRVRFIVNAPHREMGRHFNNADVFALPSLREAFGIVILEAGAFGLPVVASRVGGIPELISDGETGYLVEPGDASQLAGRLAEVLEKPERAADLGAKLHRQVQERFSWTHTWLAYDALLARLQAAKA